MTLSGPSSNLKPSIDKTVNTNTSERILREQNLPGILNRPVSPVLHGDRDYEDQNDVQRTVITSGITPEDIEFYDQLEEKQEKNWKRRLKQDEEYKRELLKVQSRVLKDNAEDNIQPPDNKVARKPRSFFEEDNKSNSDSNKGKAKAIITTKLSTSVDSSKSKEGTDSASKGDSRSSKALIEGYSSDDE
ncbi:conserved hypothetical protein [Theileria orientalis strain Shintoku]|uniref:Uncharacterized protein n=1 Tax=Theileria orientalis strain Shintoku TaxID=869250 RepID=J4DPX4_THEOR|nr:conserved hypothetical protein [Theileria orientalis strain Shintoku]BAM41459.1 conserved hypothetical protein [Theileria orientalis strain Shintoku]|eukprot:XP_009691760.1 conserved hypothetical protein [Theileria orientalis strain Shintoku]